MYRKIVVGYDNSDHSKDALALGKTLADATGAKLVVAGVRQFDHAAKAANAQEIQADLILVGSARHGRLGPGLDRLCCA